MVKHYRVLLVDLGAPDNQNQMVSNTTTNPMRKPEPNGESEFDESSESSDESLFDGSSSEDSDSEDWDISLSGLKDRVLRRRGRGGYKPSIGDTIEVYWTEEKSWFEGEVIDCRDGGNGHEYRVHYINDGKELWYDSSERVCEKL